MEKNNLIALIIVLALIVAAYFYGLSNGGDGIDYASKISDLKARAEISKTIYNDLEQKNKATLDSIGAIRKEYDKLVLERESDRSRSSKSISYAKKASVVQADSMISERFESSKDVVVFVAIADSINLEYRTLVELHKKTQEELAKTSIMSQRKSDQIVELNTQIGFKDEEIELRTMESDNLKKKRGIIFIRGIAVGVVVGGAAILFLK